MLRFVSLVALALSLTPDAATAADYPARAVKWVVSYPVGGSTDVLARLMSQWLADKLGQPFVVENKPGGGNNIGTDLVVRSAPDGYTMLLVNAANGINATLYKNLPFNFIRDIAPVAGIARAPNVMVVTNAFPARSVAEFIAYCKANPGKINMASSGTGTSVHLSGELFKTMTGCSMVHVPYKGAAPALIDLIPGQVHVMFDNLPSSAPHIKSGRVRALAVTSLEPEPSLPGVPTVAGTVQGYEATPWFGIGTAERLAARGDRADQRRSKPRALGPEDPREPRQSRREAAQGHARGFRAGHRGGDREMGESGRVLGGDRRVERPAPALSSAQAAPVGLTQSVSGEGTEASCRRR